MLQERKVDCFTGLWLTVPAPMDAANMSGDRAGMKHGTVSSTHCAQALLQVLGDVLQLPTGRTSH